jgi:hypothetical protein
MSALALAPAPAEALQLLLATVRADVEVIEGADDKRTYIHPVLGVKMDSVTTVLSATTGKPWLEGWSAKLAAEFAARNLPLLNVTAASEAGIAGVIDLIKGQAKRSRLLKADAGKLAHKFVEALILCQADPHDADTPLPVVSEELANVDMDGIRFGDFVDGLVDAFMNFVTDFDPEFLASEMKVFNPTLGIAGTLDMIVVLYNVEIGPYGKLVRAPGKMLRLCIDVKTGLHMDPGMREQLASYRRMTEVATSEGMVPMLVTDAAAVLHLRPDLYKETGYRLLLVSGKDDAEAWDAFRHVLHAYRHRESCRDKPGKVLAPLLADGSTAPTRIADLDDEGYGRCVSALAKAGKKILEELDGLTEAQLLAIKGIGPASIGPIARMLADHGLAMATEDTPQGEDEAEDEAEPERPWDPGQDEGPCPGEDEPAAASAPLTLFTPEVAE